MASPVEGAHVVFDLDALRHAGRGLPAHFVLQLPAAMPGVPNERVEVRAVLRCLPGRRWVLRACGEGGADVVLKLHARDAARALRAESEGLAALAAAGLDVPELRGAREYPDGWAVQCFGYVPASVPLDQAWAGAADELRRAWLAQLGAAFARLHADGAHQADPHLGNFLATCGRLVAVDGGAVVRGARALGGPAALRNLALLHAQFAPDDDVLARHTLDAYTAVAGRAAAPRPLPRLHAEIHRARAARIALVQRKSLRECTEFVRERVGDGWWVCRRSALEAMRPLLAAPDAAIAGGGLLKGGRTATVARVRDAAGRSWVVKRYNIRSRWHGITRALRHTRAEHAWLAGIALPLLGIPTPVPMAVRVEARAGLRGRAFLVMENAEGMELDAYARAHGEVDDSVRTAVADVLAALRRSGVVHGDLKASNFIVGPAGVKLLDLDALRLPRGRHPRTAALQRDRERFLANWPDAAERARWRAALDAADAAAASGVDA